MENKHPSPGSSHNDEARAEQDRRGMPHSLGTLGQLASSALGTEPEDVPETANEAASSAREELAVRASSSARPALLAAPPAYGKPVLVVSPQRKFELFEAKLDAIRVDPMGLYTDALHALCGNVVTMEGLWASKALRLLFDKINLLKSHEQRAYLLGSLYKAYAAQGYKSDQGYGNFTLHPEYAQLKADLQHAPETLLFEHRLIFWVNYLECTLLAIDPIYEMDKFYHQIQDVLRPKIFGNALNEMQKVTVMYTYGQMTAVMFHLAEQVQWSFEKVQRLLNDLPEELARSYRIHLLTPELNGKVVSTRLVVDLERVSNIMKGRMSPGY